MPNRFEQSAPPSIDKLYRSLPIGPFGVSPYIHARRTSRADGKAGLMTLILRLLGAKSRVQSTLRRWVFGEVMAAPLALTERRAACPPRP